MIPPDGLHPWYIEVVEVVVKNAAFFGFMLAGAVTGFVRWLRA